jgi:hypothetical protein
MTEEQNPPTTKAGILLFLGKRKKQRRASHIPTVPATAVRLVQNLNLKGASSTAVPGASPGSFFDWKRLSLDSSRGRVTLSFLSSSLLLQTRENAAIRSDGVNFAYPEPSLTNDEPFPPAPM